METIRNKIKEVMSNYRKEISDLPAVDLFNPEIQTELKEKHLKKTKEKNVKKLEDIEKDVQRKKRILEISINDKRFPASSKSVINGNELQIEVIRQRAENLAMSELNFNIVKYLKNEVEKNNIDFISYFSDAIRLNSNLPLDLRNEMNEIFNEVAISSGVTNLRKEIEIYSAIENQINLCKGAVENSSPERNIELMYADNEVSKLVNELKPVGI